MERHNLQPYSSVSRYPDLDRALHADATGVEVVRYWMTSVRGQPDDRRAVVEGIMMTLPNFPSRLRPFLDGMELPDWAADKLYDPIVSIPTRRKNHSGVYSRLVFLHSRATTEPQRHWLALAAQVFGFGEDVQEAMAKEDPDV